MTGSNAGNMLFQQSVFKMLSIPEYKLSSNGYGIIGRHDRINELCDFLVLPLANQFRPEFADRLLRMADTIRKLKVPVVVVGVGCQTDLDYDMSKLDSIREPVSRFVSAVLDHSSSIGVRGECTAAYLRSLGFRDVEVIGCPSMFMDGPLLKEPRRIAAFDSAAKITVNITAAGEQSRFGADVQKIGRVIARTVGAYDDVEFIPQEDRSLSALVRGDEIRPSEHDAIPDNAYQHMHGLGRVVAFVDPKTWINHLATRDFVFGTRLHGGIAAFLAGTPAHVVVHDSRSLEIMRHFDIPHLDIRQMSEDHDPRTMYEASDFSKMLAGHRARFDTYARFLEKNGLKHVFRDGDEGIAFEERLGKTSLVPEIRSISPSVDLAVRLRWMDDFIVREEDISRRKLRKQKAAQEKHPARLIKKVVQRISRRLRRGLGTRPPLG